MQCMIENRGLFMENNIREESRLKFRFAENDTVIKFDDTKFYRDYFNKLPEAKGVDFISVANDKIAFIEVKNCTGDEGNNRWRITPDNRKRNTTHTSVNVEGRDSLDIEIAQKTAMTIAALVGVSFNKIFAKLGSDYKKPDAITTMYKNEFKQKAWSLPAADLLYVGKSTNRKLALFGIKTIGDLARADEDVLNSHLGKMGSILWSFANGYDDSPVKLENTHAPIKSVGNSTTTPKDLVCDEDVKIVLYILAESVAARLRENGFRCRVVEISVRDNELFSFTRQKKIDHATNITGEIAAYAYQIFKENYNWSKPIRSVGVRGADLVTDNYWEQIDLFSSVEKREKQMKMDSAVDEIRRRFGFYSIQRGLMYRDRILSAVNAKEEHTVHPHGYFG